MTTPTRKELADLRALADAWDHEAHEQALAAEALREVGEHRPAWVGDGRARQLEECAEQLRAVLAEPERRAREARRRAADLGRASRTAAAEERRQRYAELRRGGYTIQQAAWELRISLRHAQRYEARCKAEGAVR